MLWIQIVYIVMHIQKFQAKAQGMFEALIVFDSVKTICS